MTHSSHTKEGDLVFLVDPRKKEHMIQLNQVGKFQTNHGSINHSDMIGLPWGSKIKTHLGKEFLMVQPSLSNLILSIKRATTIMYPKDIGYILMNMNIGEETTVIEAGTGSGALTLVLCWAVGSTGHIYTYETRKDVLDLARKNINKIGYNDRVTFKNKDIAYGFDETNIDALFLDVPNPEDYIIQVKNALRPGGFFGNLVPTTNQVSRLVEGLIAHNFAFIEVCEIMLRFYKPTPTRLRPDDRLTAHTGFLTFARPIS